MVLQRNSHPDQVHYSLDLFCSIEGKTCGRKKKTTPNEGFLDKKCIYEGSAWLEKGIKAYLHWKKEELVQFNPCAKPGVRDEGK